MKFLRYWIEQVRDDRGAAIIEFALVAPLLLMLVWGIIASGQAFYTINSLASAVRDGARQGAACDFGVPGSTPSAASPNFQKCKQQIDDVVVRSFMPLGVPITSGDVQIFFPLVAGGLGGTGIKVEVAYTYQPLTPVARWSITITRSAVFRYERTL